MAARCRSPNYRNGSGRHHSAAERIRGDNDDMGQIRRLTMSDEMGSGASCAIGSRSVDNLSGRLLNRVARIRRGDFGIAHLYVWAPSRKSGYSRAVPGAKCCGSTKDRLTSPGRGREREPNEEIFDCDRGNDSLGIARRSPAHLSTAADEGLQRAGKWHQRGGSQAVHEFLPKRRHG
jgi:hypothetical protein